MIAPAARSARSRYRSPPGNADASAKAAMARPFHAARALSSRAGWARSLRRRSRTARASESRLRTSCSGIPNSMDSCGS